MATLYKTESNGVQYEVRSAGETRRLYTDGVFHSQYNPNHILTGSVWDLLFLPTRFYEPGVIKRVLVLGVGGGAVIHMLNYFDEPEHITGIEISSIHVRVAKKYFHLNYTNLELIRDNAIHWIMSYDGEPFDLIIDDLYFEEDGEPQRAISADASWFDILKDHVTDQGMIVMNFVNYNEWRNCAFFHDDYVKQSFSSVYQFATPTCHNAVVAFLGIETKTRDLRIRLKQSVLLNPEKAACRLRYAIKKIV